MSWPSWRTETSNQELVDELYEERFGPLPTGWGEQLRRVDRCWADHRRYPKTGCPNTGRSPLGLCADHHKRLTRSIT